jgi:PAS domain S-box-containing protein
MLQMPQEQVQGPFSADARTRQRWIRSVNLAVAVGVAYFLVARLSILMVAKVGSAVFWPAAGIPAGILIALGRDARWPVAVATMTATIAANLAGRPVWLSIVFGLCTAGEALLVAGLIEHHLGRHFSLGKFRHVLGFMAAALVGTVIAAGVASLAKIIDNPGQPIWVSWQYWFSGDLVGLMAVAPFLIGLVAAVRAPPPRREIVEGAAAVVAIGMATAAIILLLPENWWEMCLLVAALFPLLLWPAARCRPVFAAATAFTVCALVVSALTFDIGHFNTAHQPLDALAMNAHLTIVGVAFCALILASVFAERAESARRLQEALSAGSVLAFEWDLDTDAAQHSDNAAQILGLEQRQLSTGASFLARIDPDDRARFGSLLSGLRRDNPSYSTAYRFMRPDGREIWLEDTARGEFDAAGRLVRLHGLGVDVTERKQAEIRQGLLASELDHRVKNVLARVVAIVTETREGSRSMDDFVKTLGGRVQSMAAAHTLLSRGRWQGVGIADLVREQLAPYVTGEKEAIQGPNVMLGAATTQALAMVVHELATNAAKFGALSTPGGRVFISWGVPSGGDGAADVTVEWRESGGPPVIKPTQLGFGTSLIEELIAHELGGAVDLAFDPGGVRCRMKLPLGRA